MYLTGSLSTVTHQLCHSQPCGIPRLSGPSLPSSPFHTDHSSTLTPSQLNPNHCHKLSCLCF